MIFFIFLLMNLFKKKKKDELYQMGTLAPKTQRPSGEFALEACEGRLIPQLVWWNNMKQFKLLFTIPITGHDFAGNANVLALCKCSHDDAEVRPSCWGRKWIIGTRWKSCCGLMKVLLGRHHHPITMTFTVRHADLHTSLAAPHKINMCLLTLAIRY